MRVLYIDGVGPFGGASRSLYEAIRAMPKDHVKPYFIATRGTVIPLYEELAVGLLATTGLTRFDNTRYSHYRGVRWIVLLRELIHIPFMLAAIFRAKRLWRHIDIIHANEITEIIPLLIAKRVFKAPVVVHVRSLARNDERSVRCRWLNDRLRNDADAVVAIDENVRSTLPSDVRVDVIHNSFTPRRDPVPDPTFLKNLETLRPTSLKVGFVGNLHHSKGLFDLLEAAKIVRQSGVDVEFVIIGGATRSTRGLKARVLKILNLAQDVQAGLSELIAQYDLSNSFHLLGATSDIQCAYERMDVLCFPSHFDAPGRPVFEAAFSAVPSIVAVTNPRPDTLVPGETGLAVPGNNPARLAEAICYFANNRSEIVRMGKNAKRLAEANFDPHTNARHLVAVYSRVVQSAQ